MSFLFPLGFLGLLAVPVLIIIYIIKNKYTEQVIASTYLWTLSERFLKRKNPINKIAGIISLILQILAVTVLSIAVAHPVFTLHGAADDYCFILDGSASMNMVNEGKSRLESAKADIRRYIDSSAEGSAFTLIYTTDYATVVFENTQDKTLANKLLNELEPSYAQSEPTLALSAAQGYFDERPNTETILFTDKSYEITDNVTVKNYSHGEKNFGLTDVGYTFTSGGVEVTGKVFSYESDAAVTVEIYFDDDTTPSASETFDLYVLEGKEFSFTVPRTDFSSVHARIKENDALALDNEVIVYRTNGGDSFRTLVVGKSPFFIQSALSAVGVSYTTLDPDSYQNNEIGGYGLYVFDRFTPEVLPKDGAVWFIEPQKNVEKSGFTVQDKEILPAAGKIAYSTSSSSRVAALLKDTVPDEMFVKQFAKCGFYRSFTTLLSYDGNPLLFVGSNDHGNREAVFSFALGEGDVAMSVNCATLVKNLISYTFPAIIDETNFICGDVITVNVMKNATSIRLVTPTGNIEYLDCTGTSVDYILKEVGTYTLTQTANNAELPSAKIFSEVPLDERIPTTPELTAYFLTGEQSNARRDGQYSNIFYLFIFLAVIVIADWMVYCYEQYQLR